MSRQVEQYINEEIRKGNDITIPTEDGMLIKLTNRSAYKLSDPHKQSTSNKNRELLNPEEYRVKGHAAEHIDELVLVGKFAGFSEDLIKSHQNDIGEDGFTYYTAFFSDADGRHYEIRFSAGVNQDQETVHSIGTIEERSFPYRGGSSGGVGHGSDRSQSYSPLGDAKAQPVNPGALVDMQKTSFNNNILKTGENSQVKIERKKRESVRNNILKSDRELLAEGFEHLAQTESERKALWEYRKNTPACMCPMN